MTPGGRRSTPSSRPGSFAQAGAHLAHSVAGPTLGAEQCPGLGQQRRTGVGERDAVRGPREQRHAELALERLDGGRDGRLGDPPPRAPGEAALSATARNYSG
ncbi:hypothetical protein Van01_55030 [Micromonospora andamanensis]|uniref:Uncharacterized protein n=1 Tax=Micromonospora andamanensis TaxID=1287068 RepID=A0ABQ4I2Z5_9ACTN|nr:hypothetical protein Van01_55030 [Micromonospora andamanensis]